MLASATLSPAQSNRLHQFGCTRSVDVHCHVLPGLDDGPANLTESLNLCQALVEDGITDVIATPHQLGRWDGANHPLEVRDSVSDLQSRISNAKIALNVYPGAEVRLDERIPQMIGSGGVTTLADHGTYLLLELPHGFSPNPRTLVPYLTAAGTRIILAHAERSDTLVTNWRTVEAWVGQGVALQINASSLMVPDARAEAAWSWLERGWVSLVASDAHGTGNRRPRMSEALDLIVRELGTETAQRVCIDNPARVLDGLELVHD